MLAKYLTIAGLLCAIHWGSALANRTWTPDGNIHGKLCGKQDTQGHQYLGIPYAKPPVGELRFAAPQPYDKKYPPSGWNGTYFRSACPQLATFPEFATASVDEDCLFLNVYVPFRRTLDLVPLPVRVWIHGGGYFLGSASQKLYDGCLSTEKSDTILVTINYRLGALGFLAHPALFDKHNGVGNNGLQDQQLALRWIQKNIRYFGGDPNKVTIFGESAGGAAVFAQMAAKGSDGLFSTAISQSGGSAEIPPLKIGYRIGEEFVRKMNCTAPGKGKDSKAWTVHCLRKASVAKLLDATPPMDMLTYSNLDANKFGPIVDGVFLPGQIIDAVAGKGKKQAPNRHPVTLMAGTNKDEASTIIISLSNSTKLSRSMYQKVVNTVFPPPYRPTALMQYNLTKYNGSEFHAASSLMTDYMFGCPTRRILAAHASNCDRGKSKRCHTYAYHYERAAPCLFMGPIPEDVGAAHAIELPYVFNNPTAGNCTWGGGDQKLSRIMLSSWNNFARTGDPSVPRTNLSHWPAWTPKKPQYAIFDVPVIIGKSSLKEKCKIFDQMAGWKGA